MEPRESEKPTDLPHNLQEENEARYMHSNRLKRETVNFYEEKMLIPEPYCMLPLLPVTIPACVEITPKLSLTVLQFTSKRSEEKAFRRW